MSAALGIVFVGLAKSANNDVLANQTYHPDEAERRDRFQASDTAFFTVAGVAVASGMRPAWSSLSVIEKMRAAKWIALSLLATAAAACFTADFKWIALAPRHRGGRLLLPISSGSVRFAATRTRRSSAPPTTPA